MSTIIEIRPEHGGKDAQDFAAELRDSFERIITGAGYSCQTKANSSVERGFIIVTDAPMKSVQWLQGLHTVQRIPKGSAARHTSGATVVVRREVKGKTQEISISPSDVRVDRYRGRGSGGQRKNKVSTAVRVVHMPTGIVITRETGRKQSDNLDSAMEELQQRLQEMQHKSTVNYVNSQREVLGDKTKTFTHNHQRNEVVQHSTGRHWPMKKWNSGNVDLDD